ncbi:unnamed protein product [marine sediment metagenome]|uniref:DNA methylase N-4/N-6 domain-containing protein n=1 Tax=marine sediment metagenome TaxID=412755 RepID=X0UN76_9ZZZZ
MKPVELVEAHLTNSTKAGDLVYEPFGGSGTTLIACERHGRACASTEPGAAAGQEAARPRPVRPGDVWASPSPLGCVRIGARPRQVS